jgi:hypothetical protein
LHWPSLGLDLDVDECANLRWFGCLSSDDHSLRLVVVLFGKLLGFQNNLCNKLVTATIIIAIHRIDLHTRGNIFVR